MKNEFLQTIKMNLVGQMENETIRLVADVVVLALTNYELIEKCTAIIPYEGAADQLMYKKFMASKLIAGFSPRSAKHYDFVIGKFSEYVQNKPLVRITTDDIMSYLSKKSFQDKISPVTLVNIKRVLNSFFAYLHKEKYLPENPVYRIESFKIPKRIKKALSEEELERLRAGGETLRDRAMIDFLYSTGVRCSELCALNILDVDFNMGTVRVIGKGNKERVAFLNAKAKISLLAYLNSRTDTNEALFCGLRHCIKKRLQVAGVEIRLRELGKKLGIDNVHPHRFRRTMATMATKRGVRIDEVSKLLGHENISTTMIYTTNNLEQVQAAHRMAIN